MPQISKESRDVLYDEDSGINDLKMSNQSQTQPPCVLTRCEDFKELCTKFIANNSMMMEKYPIYFNSDIVRVLENIAGFMTKIWFSHFPVNAIQPTQEELLCDFLVLWTKLVNVPQLSGKYDKNHQSIFYYMLKWVNSYLCGHLKILKDIKTYVLGENLESTLETLTFSTEMEDIDEPTIDPDVQRTQSAEYWVFKYISNMISSLNREAFLGYQTDKREVWFTETIRRQDGSQTNTGLQRGIHMINISENSNFSDTDISEHIKPGTDLWYHGTPTFEAAESILKEGIDLIQCYKARDFSNGSGFYVSNSYEAAKRRASRNNQRNAIVVFKMNIESSDWNVLDIKKYEHWRKVIRYHRFDKEPDEGLRFVIQKGNLEKELHVDELDCIKGYICSDLNPFKSDTYRGRDFIRNGQVPATQMCIRKEQLAEHFGSLGNMCAVIWFSRK